MNKPPRKPKIIVIIGPTASGKTDLAIKFAKKFNGEVISADSRQIYRGMDIGTDKPKGRERKTDGINAYVIRGIPHYCINLAAPSETYSLPQWIAEARKAIVSVTARGKLPIIVGGTGLYVSALVDGFLIPRVPPNARVRAKLEKEIMRHGTQRLAARILKKDPAAREFLDLQNPRRLIRAWEVMETTGKTFSRLRTRTAASPYDALFIGLLPDTYILKTRIAQRLRAQMKRGLKREVKHLARRYAWTAPGMSTLGYSQWKEELSLNRKLSSRRRQTVFDAIVADTKRYAKRQLTWWKKDARIHWITQNKKRPAQKEALKRVKIFLRDRS